MTDRRVFMREDFFFLLFSSVLDFWKSDRRISLGKERKVLYATRATLGYQKHKISPRIQVKIRKILNFWFFSDLRRSNGQNFRTKIKVTLRDESYDWVLKSRDFAGFSREIVNTYKYV